MVKRFEELPQEAIDATLAAINRVGSNADPDWLKAAHVTLYNVASEKQLLTPDDLWDAGLTKPVEARALGPVMIRGKKLGWIEQTGRTAQSRYPHVHLNLFNEWKSLIYEGPNTLVVWQSVPNDEGWHEIRGNGLHVATVDPMVSEVVRAALEREYLT